ncbi:MAG: 3'-5' exonuclease domain-containing protein 2 [Bacteroidales bacterium]|nr:3'-5' exonuclease domain-containing protein 2 [Bacteroidales bacterium]
MITFPHKTIISDEEIALYPPQAFSGEIHIVNSHEAVRRAVDYLQHCTVLGFDTETRPAFSKHVHYDVALLQLSDDKHAFLFQLQKTGIPRNLAEVLASPHVIKVGVAVHDDIKKLNEVCKRSMHGFVDLQTIAKQLHIENMGLKKLAAIVLGFRISKKQQTSNWELHSLSSAQKLYAATDAWVCYEMYRKLQEYLGT